MNRPGPAVGFQFGKRDDSFRVEFAASPEPTIGIEWEFALVDKTSRDLSNNAASVLAEVSDRTAHSGQHYVTKEFLRNTIELVTDVHHSVAEAVDDLKATIDYVRPVTDRHGVDLFGAAMHPFANWEVQELTPAPHYSEMISRTQWWGRQMLIWGVHVHVGVSHAEKVFPILNSLLLQYPHLLALSASSPVWAGDDTGYASNRALLFQQLPTAGLPFQFETWGHFESFMHDQLKSGVYDQIGAMHWDIRPSPKLGTIEIRVCDGISTVRELRAIAAFIHCLVVDLDRRLEAGETLPSLPPWHVQENKWRAARYGVDAEIILDADTNEAMMVDDLAKVLDRLEPTAARLNCADELRLVADIPKQGASYQRQRGVAAQTDSLVAVVDSVVRELRTF